MKRPFPNLVLRLESMQAALEQVAQHCSAELDAYRQCVERNPDDWTTACAARQQELNACSAKWCAATN